MTPSPLLRPGAVDDASAMSNLHHRCWIVAFTRLVEPKIAVTDMDPHRNLDRFRAWCEADTSESVTVAVLDEHVVGYSTVHGHELVHLFVDPEHAGLGLGRLLLADAEQRIFDAGHETAELHTMFGNEPAIGLYLSAGWIMTDGVIHTDDDVTYDEHVMVKHAPR